MTEPNTDLPRLAPGTYLLTKRVVVKEDGLSEFVDEPEGEYIKGFWPRTRTRVTPVVDEETNLKPDTPRVSMEELREKIGAVVDDYTAGEDYGSGPTRYYLTVGTPDDLTAHLAAVLFPGLDWLFKAVADWQSLWDEKEEWEKAAKEAWKRETALSWLHAEAVWHAEHHRAQAEHLGAVAAEVERLKDVDAEAFGARFQVQSYDIVLGRIARVLTRLLADANNSPLPKQLPHLAYRVEEEFQAVVRQRDEALTALEKQQAVLAEVQAGLPPLGACSCNPALVVLHESGSYCGDAQHEQLVERVLKAMQGDNFVSVADAKRIDDVELEAAEAIAAEIQSWGAQLQANSKMPQPLQQAAARWREGDIALDRTNFVHRRFEHGWRVVGRECGVQYDDESMETAVGPLLRLPSVPDEVDVVGAVPIEVAARLREEAGRG